MHYQHSLARDRGCTRPGCTVAGAHCQVHHANGDWADNGQTNVDDLTLGCPKDNRSVTGWNTRNAKTAAPNESPHHTSTAANRASTTTTTPRTTSSTKDDEADDG